MTTSERVQWGILGCARIAATALIPGIQDSTVGHVLAVASRDIRKAEEFKRRFAIERAYGHYADLLNDSDIRAVYIPLPNSMHKEWTIAAAEKGKHVLCEKPIACSAIDAQEMSEAFRSTEVLLMEAFAHRCHPQYQVVKEWIHAGRIGQRARHRCAG